MVDPETILTYRFYKEKPEITWKWLHDFYSIKSKAKLNKGHTALNDILEELTRRGKQVCMVTQNIDNFHIEAQEASKKNNKNFKPYPIY
jgi:NAD-dependent SIR2 family protein deacetylase